MPCPRCGHETVVVASEYVPADYDCLHCGGQLSCEEVERVTVSPEAGDAASAN
jgi:transcription elongation factor Elf1